MIKANYHTHSSYCDAKDSLKDIVEAALSQQMDALGFSSHALTSVPICHYAMTLERQGQYFKEAKSLQKALKDQLPLFVGLELDAFSPPPQEKYDYLILGCHYIFHDNTWLAIDEDPEKLNEAFKKEGSPWGIIKKYFLTLLSAQECLKADVIAHFDLIEKYNQTYHWFNSTDPYYLRIACETLDKLQTTGAFLEVNTGARSRGGLIKTYPSEALLKAFKKFSPRLVLSSDAHRKEDLLAYFAETEKNLLSWGYRERYGLFENGWKTITLEGND